MRSDALVIELVLCDRCHGDGQEPPIKAGALQSFTPCISCHERSPKPGWVWPEWAMKAVWPYVADWHRSYILNALYAQQAKEVTDG